MTRRQLVGTGLAVALIAAVTPASPGWADSTRDRQWHLGFLNVATAHQFSQGLGVTVAVVDSGVDATHPDLAGNVLPGSDVEPGASGDGHNDTEGHGTAMAGLIAAHGHGSGDSVGLLGIAPKANILPVKDGNHLAVAMPDAINWAIAHGAKVISVSQAAGADDLLLRRSIEDAAAHDIVVVAGVGNTPGTSVAYPAAYPGVVAVAGVDRQGNHADFSLTGPQVVLSAPAVDIEEVALGHGYATHSGTSDATAIVAGVAALVRSKYPNLSATEVVHRMTATAIDKGPPGQDSVYGYGIVNPVGALTADVPPLESPSSAPPPTAAPKVESAGPPWVLIGIGVVLVVVAGLVVLLVTRRRTGG